MENPLADILEIQGKTYSRRLSFEQSCAWFVAMKLGVNPKTVELAAEVSPQTAIYLRRAGDRVGGQLRYPSVAREYAKLGHEAFIHKYLTPAIRDQIRAATETLRHQVRDPLNAQGYSSRANRMVGRHEWPSTTSGKHVVFRIEEHPPLGGYLWRDLKPFHDRAELPVAEVNSHPACYLHGDETRGPEYGPGVKGFTHSDRCWRYVKSIYNPKEA